MAKVLVADDERSICQAFAQFLSAEGHEPITAYNGTEAVNKIEQERPELVFLDIQMPGMDGLQALKQIHEHSPGLPVIIMTAYGTMQTAIEAMRCGAFDYLAKPVDLNQIRSLMKQALHVAKESAEAANHADDLPAEQLTMVGNSPAIQEVFKLMGLLTTNDYTVLLTGESGVGKELVARGIHFNSERNEKPFVAVNCAAIPENLIESELFGHEKGAFSGSERRHIGKFESAADGTLFLDEIGELPYHLQSKLLRVLQEKSFERLGSTTPIPLAARIITATNRDLEAEISAGNFREDLYFRLKLVTLHIPPLRERKEDIEPLARHFLAQANQELNRNITTLETEALELLRNAPWPGNVRELEHAIKRAALVTKGSSLTHNDIALEQPSRQSDSQEQTNHTALAQHTKQALHELIDPKNPESGDSVFHTIISQVEKELIHEALNITNGNQVTAAKLLGLHRTTMRNKLRS